MAYTKEPRITISAKNCKCSETGTDIKKHEDILFYPETRKAYCRNSKEFKDFNDQLLKGENA